MSWKSLVCAGLVCLLASPVFAAPGLSVTNGGLDANGDWIWNVTVDPDDDLFADTSDNPDRGVGGSVAAELGFTAGGTALVGTPTKNATNFPSDNAGNSPAPLAGEQEGIVTSGNFAFAALGSDFFGTLNFGGSPANGQPKQMLTIITEGPSTTGSLTSSITVSGAYDASGNLGGTNGRIAQEGSNFNTYAGMASRTVKAADANLDGTVSLADLGILGANYNQMNRHWGQADFNGDGTVSLADLGVLGANYNQMGGSNTPLNIPETGAGAGAAVGVPEPASLALVGLALLAILGVNRRKK